MLKSSVENSIWHVKAPEVKLDPTTERNLELTLGWGMGTGQLKCTVDQMYPQLSDIKRRPFCTYSE